MSADKKKEGKEEEEEEEWNDALSTGENQHLPTIQMLALASNRKCFFKRKIFPVALTSGYLEQLFDPLAVSFWAWLQV